MRIWKWQKLWNALPVVFTSTARDSISWFGRLSLVINHDLYGECTFPWLWLNAAATAAAVPNAPVAWLDRGRQPTGILR